MPNMRGPWALVVASLPFACAVSFDGYELSGGGVGASSSAAASSSGGSSATTSSTATAGGGVGGAEAGGGGAGAVAAAGGTGGAPPACPTDGGDMVVVPKPGGGSYCVDETEVTQERYQAFLSAGPSTASQIPVCQGNTTFTPSCSFNPFNMAERPVVCVDWCDAYAFCAFVGKRLCGNLDGGGNPIGASADPSQSQWYSACSAAGAHDYPYGNLYDPAACNGVDSPNSTTANVGSFAQCLGGYPGLFDMSGNAREWEDSCDASNCMQRGGSFFDSEASSPHSLRCDSSGLAPRAQANAEVGFRCCGN